MAKTTSEWIFQPTASQAMSAPWPAAPLPGGRIRLMQRTHAGNPNSITRIKGRYSREVMLGTSAAKDRINIGFGTGGQATLRRPGVDTQCGDDPTAITSWRAAKRDVCRMATGALQRQCAPQGPRDGVSTRLRVNEGRFADGFDQAPSSGRRVSRSARWCFPAFKP